jgi:hypothetical protein
MDETQRVGEKRRPGSELRSELAQEPHVATIQIANIGDAKAPHAQPLHADPEGKA